MEHRLCIHQAFSKGWLLVVNGRKEGKERRKQVKAGERGRRKGKEANEHGRRLSFLLGLKTEGGEHLKFLHLGCLRPTCDSLKMQENGVG